MQKFVLIAAALAMLAGPAQAAFNSAYTALDIEQCLVLDADDFRTSWSCPGYKGYPVMVTEADLGFALLFGFGAKPSEGQSLPAANGLGSRLEWRLSNSFGRWMPIATIARYHITDQAGDGAGGQVLVVTQLLEGNSCHIAYIDALANADAEALARAAADAAGAFDCTSDTAEVIGPFSAY